MYTLILHPFFIYIKCIVVYIHIPNFLSTSILYQGDSGTSASLAFSHCFLQACQSLGYPLGY